jgi:hypothetical protein
MLSMAKVFTLACGVLVTKTGAFMLQQKGDEEVLKDTLIRDLTATFRRGHDEDRLLHFEEAVLPMFQALPKNSNGNLGQATARRALHRLFLHRHGWSIEGLLPAEDENDAATPRSISTTWMPSYLMAAIEQLFGTEGVNVQELAVLAAAFEDLAHKEAIGRLDDLYEWMNLSKDKPLDEHNSFDVIKAYMIMYTSGGNTTVRTKEHLMNKKGALNRRTLAWLKEVQHNVAETESLCDAQTGQCGQLDFKAATRVVEEIGEQYRTFNQGECQDLSNTLFDMEDAHKRGHVLLKDFYKPGLHNSWNFTEREEYLRALGALDETDLTNPRVIIPNYVYSRPNCLATSEIYVVCCKNTCEDMMAKLEMEIAAPTATPQQIENVLGAHPGLASVSLEDLAALHDGTVPLHGRAFAQWLHEAYPRKCPRPLPEGISHVHNPEDWMLETGRDSTIAQEAEKLKHERASQPLGFEAIESSSVPVVAPDPIVEMQGFDDVASFPWLRSVAAIAFMVYIALVKSSSNDGKSNWHHLCATTSAWLVRMNAPKKTETPRSPPDGNWV